MGTRGAISNKYVSLLLIFVQRRLANGARRIRRSLSIANDALRTYSSTSTCGREGVEVWQHCWPLYDSRIGRAFCEPELKGSLSQKNWNCSDPLFSGLPESIFHADPHAGNLMVQTQKHAQFTLVLLDWSQAGRLSAPLRHALIALCNCCVTGDEPSPDVLTRLESNRKSIRIPLPQGTGDPLHAAFEIVQQLVCRAIQCPQTSPPAQILPDAGRNYAPARPRFQCLTGNPRVCLRSVRKRSRRANLEHSIPVARPTRFLSFRAAHANARGSFRGHDSKKSLCKCNKLVDAFRKSVRCFI